MRSKSHGRQPRPVIRVWPRSRIYAIWLTVWAVIAGIYVWLWPSMTPFDRWAHLGEIGSSAAIAAGLLALFSTALPGLTLTIWTAFLSLGVAMTDLALAFLAQWHFGLAAVGFISVAVLFYNTLLAESDSVLVEWRTDIDRPFGPIEDWVASVVIRDPLRSRLRQLFHRVDNLAKNHPWVVPCAALLPTLTAVPLGLDLVVQVAASLLRTSGVSSFTVAVFVTTSVFTLICIPAAALWAAHADRHDCRRVARQYRGLAPERPN